LQSLLSLFLLVALFLIAPSAQAQLPAGTTDSTSQPQSAPQDPLRAEANAALDKQDYPTALKLLTTLADKNPSDAHLLYDLAFTQDALDQSAAEATYRRAIAADATYFEPHLALGLLLARNGKLGPAVRLMPTTAATTIRKDQDPPLVIDGPFAETKEQLLGFYVVDCATLDEAVEFARDLARANPGGAYEIRPVRLYLPGSE